MIDLFPKDMINKATELLNICRQKQIRLVTAESCTGGLIGAMLTEIAGSSDVVECGYITYSNHAKMTLLNVLSDTLEKHGAVSQEVATQMARGAINNHKKEHEDNHHYLAISVTGIAGPDGGSDDKPVGTVWISCASLLQGSQSYHTEKHLFDGNRTNIRIQTVETAIKMLQIKAETI